MDKEELLQKLKEAQETPWTPMGYEIAHAALLDYIGDAEITTEYKKLDRWYE